MPIPTTRNIERSRTKKGKWRKKRSDAGKKRGVDNMGMMDTSPEYDNLIFDKKPLKKIVGIDGCQNCPLREYESRSGQSYCTHQVTEGRCITGWQDIPKWCPLPDDA